MISTTAVDRLIQLGRRRGGLQIDDIRQALPVDTMTIEELADVVARLEEAGIAVEIDAGMLTPHHRKMPRCGILIRCGSSPILLEYRFISLSTSFGLKNAGS
jgi:Sigma-70 factor, region 1.1